MANAAVELLSRQGYVPPTCTLPDPPAFALIMSEVGKGRSPCWGCNMDRAVCKGQPKQVTPPDTEAGEGETQ